MIQEHTFDMFYDYISQLNVKNSRLERLYNVYAESDPLRGGGQTGLLCRALQVGHCTTPGRTIHLDQGSANRDPWDKSSLTSVFVNKALLEHGMTCSFINYHLWWLSSYVGRVE